MTSARQAHLHIINRLVLSQREDFMTQELSDYELGVGQGHRIEIPGFYIFSARALVSEDVRCHLNVLLDENVIAQRCRTKIDVAGGTVDDLPPDADVLWLSVTVLHKVDAGQLARAEVGIDRREEIGAVMREPAEMSYMRVSKEAPA